MASPRHKLWLRGMLGTLALLSFAALPALLVQERALPRVEGKVLVPGMKLDIPWRTFDENEVDRGATIPPDTHVIFHIPEDAGRITRRILFGLRGRQVRYWGYCFNEDYDPDTSPDVEGFPGKLFLSEAERARREEERKKRFPAFSIYNPPTEIELRALQKTPKGLVRHQIEVFLGGQTCYVMTELPLPLGTDRDDDLLNASMEHHEHTDPNNADTDGDGVGDGLEVLSLGTDPLRRDTDADGLIDGIEDANRNGRRNVGETNPLEKDSDRDRLCDGFCRLPSGGRICSDFKSTRSCAPAVTSQWRGEDKNLNGVIDEGETDPLKVDTDGDGINDEQEFFNCLLAKKTDC